MTNRISDGTPEVDLNLDLSKTEVVNKVDVSGAECCACATPAAEPPVSKEEEKKDTKKTIWIILSAVVVFGIIAGILVYTAMDEDPITIDGLHSLNVAGELEPEQGYMYNGYSFIKYADVWYTQIQHKGTTYDVTFNFDPKAVEDIPVEGRLSENFVKDGKIFITFDPRGTELKWVAVANFGISRSLAWAFEYEVKAGCTKNETLACQQAGVVQCGDPDKAVIYFKEADDPRVILSDNCVIVQGRGEDMVKAKDRLLLRWYGITDENI